MATRQPARHRTAHLAVALMVLLGAGALLSSCAERVDDRGAYANAVDVDAHLLALAPQLAQDLRDLRRDLGAVRALGHRRAVGVGAADGLDDRLVVAEAGHVDADA